MQRSHDKGWQIEWNGTDWVFSDTKKISDGKRPCKRCGRSPTPEGHDACLGIITGAVSACCGHGVEKPFIVYENMEKELCNAIH
jgi:hypothetical protein